MIKVKVNIKMKINKINKNKIINNKNMNKTLKVNLKP